MQRGVWWGRAESEAGDSVFDLLQRLIDTYGSSRPLMPLVVLQAEGGDAAGGLDERVSAIVEFVHDSQRRRGLLSRLLDADGTRGGGPYTAAIAMLRELSELPWDNERESQYKAFSFPRSRLLRAIEEAAPEADTGGFPDGSDSRGRLLNRLAELRWRPGPHSAPGHLFQDVVRAVINPSGFVGAVVAGYASGVLGGSGLLASVAFGLAALAVFSVLYTAARHSPPLLYLRPASKWFATTTFLTVSSGRPPATDWSRWRPAKSGEVIRARAFTVAQQVNAAASVEPSAARSRARQFHLELRVLALLEDLRHDFLPRTLDLRRRKRTVPPVVFLPHTTEANGGVPLLHAISNVRSRRSELDPLLVLAAVPAAESLRPADIDAPLPDPVREPAIRPDADYDAWVTSLTVSQSPSQAANPPWVLRVGLPTDQLVSTRSTQRTTTKIRRTPVRVLWSRTVVLTTVTALVGLGLVANVRLGDRYCDGQLFASNTDSVWVKGPLESHRQCIGVATGDVHFGSGNMLSLAGSGKGITFAAVERGIREQNKNIGSSEFVTIIYAGPLTSARSSEKDTRKGLEEMTGAYISQYQHNISSNQSVKIRLLLANGGQGMLHQVEMAHRIVRLARQDPSVVGVVGMGRNTTDSGTATGILEDAGLVVVDTTNSSTDLAKDHANYFGLAATDQEETKALSRFIGKGKDPGNSRAVVLSRQVENNDHDLYTEEQAKYGEKMLETAGFQVDRRSYALGSGGSANLNTAVRAICGGSPALSVLYFAGRVEDTNNLMGQLSGTGGCSEQDLIVFAGDDLAKFNDDNQLAPNVTLYYASLAPITKANDRASFYNAAETVFTSLRPIDEKPDSTAMARSADEAFTDGQTVLTYTATTVLHEAASDGDQAHTAGRTWVNLYSVELNDMPTGKVSFKGTRPGERQTGHGLKIMKVAQASESSAGLRTEQVCLKLTGNEKTTAHTVECLLN